MIIEGESDQGQMEHEGRKRKFEQQRGGPTQGNIQGPFQRRNVFQSQQSGSFVRQGTGTQGPVIQSSDSNQPRLIRSPFPDCGKCGKKHVGAYDGPRPGVKV